MFCCKQKNIYKYETERKFMWGFFLCVLFLLFSELYKVSPVINTKKEKKILTDIPRRDVNE